MKTKSLVLIWLRIRNLIISGHKILFDVVVIPRENTILRDCRILAMPNMNQLPASCP